MTRCRGDGPHLPVARPPSPLLFALMDEPLHHIERPGLPWRPDHRRTLCGRDVDGLPVWSRDEAMAEARKLGRQRFALFACMTCAGVFSINIPWEESPAECLRGYLARFGAWRSTNEADVARFEAELRAIAMLIEAHRGEFDDTVEALLEVPSLRAHREERVRRGLH